MYVYIYIYIYTHNIVLGACTLPGLGPADHRVTVRYAMLRARACHIYTYIYIYTHVLYYIYIYICTFIGPADCRNSSGSWRGKRWGGIRPRERTEPTNLRVLGF